MAAERFNQRVQITRQNTSTGAASGLMALGDQFQRISQQQFQKVEQQVSEKGVEEGRSAFVKGEKPEFKEERFIGGVHAKAFNKGLAHAYKASLANDMRTDLSNIVRENPDDVENFDLKVAGLKSGINEVDPHVRNDVTDRFNDAVTGLRVRVQDNQAKTLRKEQFDQSALHLDVAAKDVAQSARLGDSRSSALAIDEHHGAVDAMVDAELITASQGANRKNAVDRESSEQWLKYQVDNIIESGPEGHIAAFEHVKKLEGKAPEEFTPDQWDAVIASVQTDINQARVRAVQKNTVEDVALERKISNLHIEANTGLGDPADIVKRTEAMFIDGSINGKERTTILTKVINRQQKEIENAVDLAAVSKRLKGNRGIVVDDKVADQYYKEVITPAFEGMTVEKINAEKVNYVNAMRRIPTVMRDELRTALASKDPVLIRDAAELIDKIDAIPGVFDDVATPQQRAYVANLLQFTNANMHPAEAEALATELTNPTDKARIEATTLELAEDKKGFNSIDYRDIVDNHFDPYFGSTKVGEIAGYQLAKEFEILYEALRKAGSPKDAAKEKALGLIERNWKVSEVTGRVMKYRPDDDYSVGGDVSYIRKQLAAEVNREWAFETPIREDQIFLQATESTARAAAGNMPAYRIVVIEDDGTQMPLLGNGLWVPDMQAEIDRVSSENKANAEKAQKKAQTKPKLFLGKGLN